MFVAFIFSRSDHLDSATDLYSAPTPATAPESERTLHTPTATGGVD